MLVRARQGERALRERERGRGSLQTLCTVPEAGRLLPATARYDPARDGALVTCQRYESEILFQDGIVAQRSSLSDPGGGGGGGGAADCPAGTQCRVALSALIGCRQIYDAAVPRP